MSEFVSNVLKLASGSVIAQILGILLIPIITRLYSPNDFGYFSLILSISTIVVIFSSLSYVYAIMLPKDDEDAANIVILSCLLILFFSIMTGLIILFFDDFIGSVLNAPEITQYLWIVPIIVFVSAMFSVLTYWNSRKKRFGTYAIAQVFNSLSSKGVQVMIGIGSPSTTGLIAGHVTGYIGAIIIMLKGFGGDIFFFKQVSKKRIKELMVRYKKFPLYSSWSVTANTISIQIVPLLLVYFYSPVIVGYYALASQVVNIPMGLIGSAVGQVFFQKACEIKNISGRIDHIVQSVHRRLISIGIFPVLLILIIGEDLFVIILGMQWYTAGMYAKILIPWLFFVFIASPLSSIFTILELQHIDLSFNILLLLSRIGVLWIGGIFFGPEGTLIIFSITGVIIWGGLNFYLLKLSNISFKEGLMDYFHYLVIGLAVATPLILIKIALPYLQYGLIITGIIVGIIYYIIIIREDKLLKENLLKFIGR